MSIKFQTDQSGANTNICSGTNHIFNFSLATSNILGSADLSIKKGSGTTAPIVVTVYDQPNGSGNVVESVSVLAANVTQTFSNIVFTFSGNTTLNANTNYSLVVTSTTSCVGNNPYSMKSGNFQVVNDGTVINIGYGIATAISGDTTIISSGIADYNVVSNVENTVLLQSQAIRSTNYNRKINIDGTNIPVKIFLGSQRRRVYHANRMIIDIT